MRIAVTILLAFWSLGLEAQSEEYREKLDELYSKTVPFISVAELRALQASDTALILLDTRQLEEFEISHIQGAQLAEEKTFKSSDLDLKNKDLPIVVYCSVGYRSEKLGEKLLKAGFTDVRNLYGGIFQWVNEENPVVDQENRKTHAVHTYSKKWSVWLERGVKIYE